MSEHLKDFSAGAAFLGALLGGGWWLDQHRLLGYAAIAGVACMFAVVTYAIGRALRGR